MYDFFTQTLFACPVYKNYGKLISEEHYQPIGAIPSLIRKDFGLILQASQNAAVPRPLASLVHDWLTAMVSKGRDWTGFAEEISESVGLRPGASESWELPAHSKRSLFQSLFRFTGDLHEQRH